MTKSEFISAVAMTSGLTKKATEQTFEAMVEVFENIMKQNEKLVVTGICTIGVKTVAPKSILNPQTKQPMTTKESKSLYIKTGAVLKSELNK